MASCHKGTKILRRAKLQLSSDEELHSLRCSSSRLMIVLLSENSGADVCLVCQKSVALQEVRFQSLWMYSEDTHQGGEMWLISVFVYFQDSRLWDTQADVSEMD